MSGNETARRAGPADVCPLGIIMLDTAFPRPPGDVGNPASWPFPVMYETVPRASVRTVVGQRCAPDVFDRFVAAGNRLVERGAYGILTSCGFLAQHQAELAARLPVPVASSALLLLPMLARVLPARQRVGVVTYDAAALGDEHFLAVGADPATPRAGLPSAGAFHALIERGGPYDRMALEEEVIEAASDLCRADRTIGAIVLECTNLPPFSAAIAHELGRPVYDVLSLGRWLQAGFSPLRY